MASGSLLLAGSYHSKWYLSSFLDRDWIARLAFRSEVEINFTDAFSTQSATAMPYNID